MYLVEVFIAIVTHILHLNQNHMFTLTPILIIKNSMTFITIPLRSPIILLTRHLIIPPNIPTPITTASQNPQARVPINNSNIIIIIIVLRFNHIIAILTIHLLRFLPKHLNFKIILINHKFRQF